MWVVARERRDLAAVRNRLDVETISADIADPKVAKRILADVRPGIVVLNAGAAPPMGPIDQISWDDFTVNWNTDVQGTLYWLQAALNLPLARGSRVLVVSSGAAQTGSPLSGGYGGAKRMQWMMVKYASGLAERKELGVRFQVIVPKQMVGGTGVGDAGSSAYARAQGISPEAFLQRFGTSMPPRLFGDYVVRVLSDRQYDGAIALGLKGDTGITMLEEETA